MPLDQPAKNFLGPAVVVLIGTIKEVDAGITAGFVHAGGCGFVSVTAEGHGAEAQFGDLNAGTAEGFESHVRGVFRLCGREIDEGDEGNVKRCKSVPSLRRIRA